MIFRRIRGLCGRIVLAGIVGLCCFSCSSHSYEGMVIAVELAQGTGTSYEGARLIALDPEAPDHRATLLTEKFHSASSPVLSNNGRYLIFSGKVKQEDPWQIWVRDLQKRSASRVTDLQEDCTDPAFLPDGMILFSRSGFMMNREIATLYKCNRDGSDLQQLTFHPHSDKASSVLNDGRILYTSSQQYPTERGALLMVMLPDGSKSQLYYQGSDDRVPASKAIESTRGDIYFIESITGEHVKGKLARIHQNRPMNTYTDLSKGIEGDFHSVTLSGDDSGVVSFRSSAEEPFALYWFHMEDGTIGDRIYGDGKSLLDPVMVVARPRPRILPSAVNPNNPTGLLMAQNINHSVLPANHMVSGDSLVNRIQVVGLQGLMGEVEAAEDGSIYLKIDANTPFQLRSVNPQGDLVRGPSGWIWLRPNERRGCVGCHADPELAPENRVPLAVKQSPAVITANQGISKLEESE